MVTVSSAFTSANDNDEKRAIAVAKAAVSQECGAVGDANAAVEENFICNDIDGGFGNMNRTITFYRVSPCPPNQVCIQIVEVVGSAVVDCEFNVTSVTCGEAVTM
ncbi:MAG: hypothetical protein ACLGGV_09765 [Bacteroidia bacterium]